MRLAPLTLAPTFAALLVTLLLTACAGKKPVPAAPAPTTPPVAEDLPPSTEPAPAGTTRIEAPQEEDPRFLEASPLRKAISHWIADHPKADFDEASRMANRFLRRYGYPMVLDASPLLNETKDAVKLKAGNKIFVFHAGKELSRTPDVCGERFLRISARVLGKDQAALWIKKKEYPFSLEDFRREAFKVYKNDELLQVLHSPEPTEPIGLAANGKALYIKFPLNEEAVAVWWQRMGEQQPAVADEEPYLVLRAQAGRLYFDEDIEHLPPQEFEVIENKEDKNTFRWFFPNSQLTLELDSKCE